MKIVVQRVLNSSVSVEGRVVGEISAGLLLLVGLEEGDRESTLVKAAEKIKGLRIFEDTQGKMNRSVREVSGKVLCVSQFTLAWDGRKGNRPSFDKAMEPNLANKMFEQFITSLKEQGLEVETGTFGADMQVSLVNDGPVTFHLSF